MKALLLLNFEEAQKQAANEDREVNNIVHQK